MLPFVLVGAGQAAAGQLIAYDRWRDADGTHVPVCVRVEQTEIDARMGVSRSRLRARSEVSSRGATRLVVRFKGEDQPVSIRTHLVRVVPSVRC